MNQFFSESQKKNLLNSILAVFVLLAVFLGIKTINAIREYSYIGRGVYAANVISVSGKGEMITIPDVATFSVTVSESAKTMKDAQDKSAKKMNSIIEAVKSMGVEEKDIKTTNYSSYPKYEWNRTPCIEPLYDTSSSVSVYPPCSYGKNVLVGYEVSQTIAVKIRKTATAGDVLTKVGSFGASNISGLDFIVDDMDKVKTEAREKAIADAKMKAKILSKSLGVNLSKIVNFYEAGDQPVYYSMDSVNAKGMGGSMASVSPEIPVGENKIISNVTITYEVK